MVCFAQQFESLVEYGDQVVRRKKLPRSIDVECACNEALRQWVNIEGEYETLHLSREMQFLDPPPLLKHIVTHRLLDFARVEFKRLARLSEQDVADIPSKSQPTWQDEMEPLADELEREASYLIVALRRYFAQIRPRTRDTIRLRLLAGMSARDVAEIMRCSENAVHLTMSRFTKFMRDAAM